MRNGSGTVICGRCFVADTFFSRLRGLLGRRRLPSDEGLLLTPASGIHTWFMRFPIDAVFLEADLTVLGTRESIRPWRMVAWRGARAILELPPGACERWNVRPGDRLSLSEAAESTNVLLVLRRGDDAQLVVGRGPISAATRTISAMGELDVGVSAVLLPDEPAEGAA